MRQPDASGLEGADCPRPQSVLDVFIAFTSLALHGFGGVLPWAHRTLVEQRRWLSREEFTELLAFAQLLPGPNICNLGIIVGHRYFGWRGALAGLLGLILVPAILVVLMGLVYSQLVAFPAVQRALSAMSAVAAGLIMATALKLAFGQRKRWRWLVFGVLSFVAIGLFRVPLAQTLLVLGPIAVGLAWWREGR